MTQQNRTEIIVNTMVAALLTVASAQFTGLADPWIAILCGIATALSLRFLPIRHQILIFMIIAGIPILETAPWFIPKVITTFGASGLATSILLASTTLNLGKRCVRFSQVIPPIVIISMMPIPSSFGRKAEKIAFLEGGVWATAAHLPLGAEALSTKHQYTYECFRDALNATNIKTSDSISGFDKLIIITPTTPFDLEFVNKVTKWTAQGGKLLIVADHTNLFGHQTVLSRLTNEFGIGLRPDGLFETDTNGGVYGNLFNQFAGLTPCSISKGVIPRLKMRGWSEAPDYTAPSFFGELDPTNDDRIGSFPVLGSRRYGIGEVSIFTDSTFFANFANQRWSSQSLLGSIFWPLKATILAILGLTALLVYLARPLHWLAPLGISLILIAPSTGFKALKNLPTRNIVKLAPPGTIANDSEERDKGVGSALLASAYAFGVGIQWDSNAPKTFKKHILENGIPLISKNSDEIPTVDTRDLAGGKFYIDQNSFWFSQGAGMLRSVNMANLWKSLGANVLSVDLTVIEKSKRELIGPDGKAASHSVETLCDGWILIDQRVVAKWIPENSKWLARKEWQFGTWLKKDILFEPKN